MIKYGTNNIWKLYFGSNSIGKAYYGSNLVFDKSGGVPPTPQPEFHTYIVFDGTAYIETNFTPVENASYASICGHETMKSAQTVFSNLAGTNARMGVSLSSNTNSTTRYFSVYYGSTSAVLNNVAALGFSTATYGMYLTPSRFGYGNYGLPLTKGNNNPTGPLIFGQNPTKTGVGYTGTMSTFYVFDSEAQNADSYSALMNFTPIATFRPCLYQGEAGMWYVEGNMFFGNSASSGTITTADV